MCNTLSNHLREIKNSVSTLSEFHFFPLFYSWLCGVCVSFIICNWNLKAVEDRKNIYSAAGTRSRMWRERGSLLLGVCYGGRGDLNGVTLLRSSVLQLWGPAVSKPFQPQSCQQRAPGGQYPSDALLVPEPLQLLPATWRGMRSSGRIDRDQALWLLLKRSPSSGVSGGWGVVPFLLSPKGEPEREVGGCWGSNSQQG